VILRQGFDITAASLWNGLAAGPRAGVPLPIPMLVLMCRGWRAFDKGLAESLPTIWGRTAWMTFSSWFGVVTFPAGLARGQIVAIPALMCFQPSRFETIRDGLFFCFPQRHGPDTCRIFLWSRFAPFFFFPNRLPPGPLALGTLHPWRFSIVICCFVPEWPAAARACKIRANRR